MRPGLGPCVRKGKYMQCALRWRRLVAFVTVSRKRLRCNHFDNGGAWLPMRPSRLGRIPMKGRNASRVALVAARAAIVGTAVGVPSAGTQRASMDGSAQRRFARPYTPAAHRLLGCPLIRYLSISAYVESKFGERCLLLTAGTRAVDRGLGRRSGADVQGAR